MAAKKNSFITADLEWAESQLSTWKSYVNSNPIHELTDRVQYRLMKNGGTMPMVVASIEQQIKCIQDTMAKYLQLLEVIDKLRERENSKVESRGNSEISDLAEEFINRTNE